MNELDEVILKNVTVVVTIINSTTVVDLTPYYQYIGFGLAAILANLFIIFVLCQNKQQFKRSAFFIGLAGGDILNGLALLVSGTVRLSYAKFGMSNLTVRPFTCIQSFTQLFISGNQITAIMLTAIGGERFLAVKYFEWYYNRWSNKMAWICTAVVYGYSLLSLAAAWMVVYWQQTALISISCGTPSVVGKPYSIYNYSLAIVGGTLATILTVAACVSFATRKRLLLASSSNSMHGYIRRQWRLTKAMACVAALDFGLVVIPNVLLLLIGGLSVPLKGNIGAWSLQVICSRSAMNALIYLFISRDFRQAVKLRFSIKTPVQPTASVSDSAHY